MSAADSNEVVNSLVGLRLDQALDTIEAFGKYSYRFKYEIDEGFEEDLVENRISLVISVDGMVVSAHLDDVLDLFG